MNDLSDIIRYKSTCDPCCYEIDKQVTLDVKRKVVQFSTPSFHTILGIKWLIESTLLRIMVNDTMDNTIIHQHRYHHHE